MLGAGATDDRIAVLVVKHNLALAKIHLDRAEEAVPLVLEVAQIVQHFGTGSDFMAAFLAASAAIELEQERADSAARLLAAAEAVLESVGGSYTPGDRELHERTLDNARSRLSDTDFAAAWSEGRGMGPDAAFALAVRDLEALAPPRAAESESIRNAMRADTPR